MRAGHLSRKFRRATAPASLSSRVGGRRAPQSLVGLLRSQSHLFLLSPMTRHQTSSQCQDVPTSIANAVIRLSNAELYDPKTEQWTNAASIKFVRGLHTAALLTNGLVLVAGGWNEDHNFRFDAELYDPVLNTWRMTGPMPFESRFFYASTSLTNGQ